ASFGPRWPRPGSRLAGARDEPRAPRAAAGSRARGVLGRKRAALRKHRALPGREVGPAGSRPGRPQRAGRVRRVPHPAASGGRFRFRAGTLSRDAAGVLTAAPPLGRIRRAVREAPSAALGPRQLPPQTRLAVVVSAYRPGATKPKYAA